MIWLKYTHWSGGPRRVIATPIRGMSHHYIVGSCVLMIGQFSKKVYSAGSLSKRVDVASATMRDEIKSTTPVEIGSGAQIILEQGP